MKLKHRIGQLEVRHRPPAVYPVYAVFTEGGEVTIRMSDGSKFVGQEAAEKYRGFAAVVPAEGLRRIRPGQYVAATDGRRNALNPRAKTKSTPLAWSDAMQSTPKSDPAASQQARVLIAEDNSLNAELVKAYLGGREFEIRIASDGEKTLQIIRAWRPDLILLDVRMPKISGFEVCKRLRADPASGDMAVLMITALDQATDVDQAVEAGTDDFLTKPINKNELLLRVRSLLKSRHNTCA